MNITDGILGHYWILLSWAAFAVLFVLALFRAPWRHLSAADEDGKAGARFNTWLGFIVALMLLWSMKAGVRPGFALHLLGGTVFTLAFGPWLAFIGLCLVLAGVAANGAISWEYFAVNALVMGALPVFVSNAVLRFSERFLPRQIFVYIFVDAFFGAGLAVLAVGLCSSLLLCAASPYGSEFLFGEYLPVTLLVAFSEAWLSGMMITLFVVYRPQWVASFKDSLYLRSTGNK
ncbi:MAG: energy-coupling factor ABC transporter permease [Betaproteobacteria bacterium]|nr:energy-coupling factor ABC transporter permease [Betaproteobacteria bacterium]